MGLSFAVGRDVDAVAVGVHWGAYARLRRVSSEGTVGQRLPGRVRSAWSRATRPLTLPCWSVTSTIVGVDIHGSAHHHGVATEDMLHAPRNAVIFVEQEDGVTVALGPDRAGRLLEVGFVDADEEDAVLIHAMPMRRKYERFL